MFRLWGLALAWARRPHKICTRVNLVVKSIVPRAHVNKRADTRIFVIIILQIYTTYELKLLKMWSWELIYLLYLLLLVNMIYWWGCVLAGWKGLRCGHSSRGGGVLGAVPTLKKGGLRCRSGKKGGSLSRHIPMLNIYASTPRGWQYCSEPPPPPPLNLVSLSELIHIHITLMSN